MPEPVLLLTATIDPRGMRYTVRNDPQQRKQDYLCSLGQWLESDFRKIVFCENSGSDLADFKRMTDQSGKEVELISFEAEPYEEKLGKGYGECLIIERALQSPLLESAPLVMKVTGRLFMKNQAMFAAFARSEHFDICMDMYRSLDEVDVRTFMASAQFFTEYLLPRKMMLDEMVEPMMNLERVAARALHHALADGLTWRPLPTSPAYTGYSASHGYRYKPWKNAISRRLRMVLPPPGFAS